MHIHYLRIYLSRSASTTRLFLTCKYYIQCWLFRLFVCWFLFFPFFLFCLTLDLWLAERRKINKEMGGQYVHEHYCCRAVHLIILLMSSLGCNDINFRATCSPILDYNLISAFILARILIGWIYFYYAHFISFLFFSSLLFNKNNNNKHVQHNVRKAEFINDLVTLWCLSFYFI